MELMLVEVCQGKEAIHHIDPTRYAPFISLNRVATKAGGDLRWSMTRMQTRGSSDDDSNGMVANQRRDIAKS